jgi:GH15 family glucan-1,4-alpha-glucosidase
MPFDRDAGLPIEDYALIGDCVTAALVGKDGSIDWLCWPRFDSAACFAALLGTREHGRYQIAPAAEDARITRRYRDDTLVLETLFETDQGQVALIDFMVPGAANSCIVRVVEGRSGRVDMRMLLRLRFDYGISVPWVTQRPGGNGIVAVAGPEMVVLRTNAALRGEDLTTVSDFTVAEGERVSFVLTRCASHLPMPISLDADDALYQTEEYWHAWSRKCSYDGPWADAVRRSLLTLKCLTYAETGGIVAAPTTSLPERLGGVRNWDYRFCWLRDATLTLFAFLSAGYHEEATAWGAWLRRSVAGSPGQVQIMYGIAGERRLEEWEVGWLPGYQGAKPVRIGNAAAAQMQLDVYGEVCSALHRAREQQILIEDGSWPLQCAFLEHLETIWREPDQGIWEVRGGPQHFTFSKVMAWLAFARAIQDAETFGFEAPVDHWKQVRDEIYATVCREGIDKERNCFVQSFGAKALDASLLLIPAVGFLPADDPRVTATIEAIERELLVDGFVLRYRTEQTEDGLPGREGAFLACSFWLAAARHLQERKSEANEVFERLLNLRNDVGLLAEEYDPSTRRFTGNFPQAFSHMALVATAMSLSGRRQTPHK